MRQDKDEGDLENQQEVMVLFLIPYLFIIWQCKFKKGGVLICLMGLSHYMPLARP